MGPQEIQLGPQARQDPPSNQKFCPILPQRPHLRVANTHSVAFSAKFLTRDDAPFPLAFCAGSDADGAYGSCTLDAFVAGANFSQSIEWGNEAWNATCGASDF